MNTLLTGADRTEQAIQQVRSTGLFFHAQLAAGTVYEDVHDAMQRSIDKNLEKIVNPDSNPEIDIDEIFSLKMK